MLEKLDFITDKYNELSAIVSDPEVIANQAVWQKHVKEMGEMEPIVKKYQEYKKVKEGIDEAKELLSESGSDDEMKELAKMELDGNKFALHIQLADTRLADKFLELCW